MKKKKTIIIILLFIGSVGLGAGIYAYSIYQDIFKTNVSEDAYLYNRSFQQYHYN